MEYTEEQISSCQNGESAEGKLWTLYYSILHTSRMIPWDDAPQQEKLLSVLTEIKRRPDPPAPSNITPALRKDWVWSSEGLWGNLFMLGPCAREMWNQDPEGDGIELRAVLNICGFLARVTAAGLSDFCNYAVWAIRDSLERDTTSFKDLAQSRVWLHLAGEKLCDSVVNPLEKARGSEVDLKARGKQLPWRTEVSGVRWSWWLERFREESQKEQNEPKVREVAEACAKKMEQLNSNKAK